VSIFVLAGQTSAQKPTVWIDALASSARPLAGVVERPASVYGLLGARARWHTSAFDLGASGYLGSGARQEYGRWGAVAATASTGHQLGSVQSDLEFDFFALHYTSPSRYTILSLTTRPALSYRLRGLDLVAGAELSLGRWGSQTDFALDPVEPTQPPEPGAVERAGTLRVAGARASIAAPLASGTVTLAGSMANALNENASGDYGGASLGALQVVGGWDLMLESQVQVGPARTEFGGFLRAGRALGEQLYLSAEVGRRVTDYNLGTSSHNSVTFGVSWRPGPQRPSALKARPTVVRVMYRETRGTRVEFRLPRTAASSVALIGSFTEWEPKAMERTDEGWTVTLLLPEGSHQFAFLLDGQRWYLPEGAPGVVDDGFGRKNATVVISQS
jgi:hypothetical protein